VLSCAAVAVVTAAAATWAVKNKPTHREDVEA
jgi:hypothetical protein